MRYLAVAFATFCVLTLSQLAGAQTTFNAFLDGAHEFVPTGSPATGFGQVVLNAAQTQITVDESWSGLTMPATASHIHGPAPAGAQAAVLFPFSGVPAATAGSIPEQTFAITSAQVSDLFNGLYYMNVHTANFPAGEIRGQLAAVPEPASTLLLGIGAGLLLLKRRAIRPCAEVAMA